MYEGTTDPTYEGRAVEGTKGGFLVWFAVVCCDLVWWVVAMCCWVAASIQFAGQPRQPREPLVYHYRALQPTTAHANQRQPTERPH